MVVEDHLAEALLRVDGEPVVLGEAPGDGVVPDEVRHRARGVGPEDVLGRFGGLEEHVAVAVAVQLARALTGEADVVAALEEYSGDVDDGVGPVVLRGDDVVARHRPRPGGGRRRGADGIGRLREEHAPAANVRVGVELVRIVDHAVGTEGHPRRTRGGDAGSARRRRRRGGRHVPGPAPRVGVRVVLIRIVDEPGAGRGARDRRARRDGAGGARLSGAEGADHPRADDRLGEALHGEREGGEARAGWNERYPTFETPATPATG